MEDDVGYAGGEGSTLKGKESPSSKVDVKEEEKIRSFESNAEVE